MKRLQRALLTVAATALLASANIVLASDTVKACWPEYGRGGIVNGPWDEFPMCSGSECLAAECYCGADFYDESCGPRLPCMGSSCTMD